MLDTYLRARFAETRDTMTQGFEIYRMDEAVAPIASFVEDLSTWYIRRSRDRIKSENNDGSHARETLRTALTEFAKCLAPIAPFYAEYMFSEMRKYSKRKIFLPESVHLAKWVKRKVVNRGVIEKIEEVRKIVSLAHEQRSDAGIKVRQPLTKVIIQQEIDEAAKELIKDEINVKEVVTDGHAQQEVTLITEITKELKEEGFVRECMRNLQKLRKEQGFSPTETLSTLYIHTTNEKKECLQKFEEKIKQEVRIDNLVHTETAQENANEFTVEGATIKVAFEEQPGKIFS